MHFRWSRRRLSIWILLLLQVFLIGAFIYIQQDSYHKPNRKELSKVSFLSSSLVNTIKTNNISYLTLSDKIYLKYTSTSNKYVNFNMSMCFVNGTDLKVMQRSENNWRCECIAGWHGPDCGQPEVIWRAFLTSRKPVKIRGPRKYHRRLIYIFEVNKYSKVLAEIRINELQDTVDLFVVCEENGHDFLKRSLENGFLKKFHYKILYAGDDRARKMQWLKQNVIRNVKDDDLIMFNNSSDIPNRLALEFLKTYDTWPEPLHFRLRWSVYGFFWTHPWKTALKGGASTFAYLKKYLNSDVNLLVNNKTFVGGRGLTVGDLNHYGGWLCEFCIEESALMVDLLYKNISNQPIQIQADKIDTSYVEDLIENGVYMDGRTELVRSRRYQEAYYAPTHVVENSWKYDFLYTNLYSKLDYY